MKRPVLTFDREQEPCPTCSGVGKVACPMCGGDRCAECRRGLVRCDDCDGVGVVRSDIAARVREEW